MHFFGQTRSTSNSLRGQSHRKCSRPRTQQFKLLLRSEPLESRLVLATGLFVDVVDSLDLLLPGKFSGAAWLDYDNDGRQDLFVNGAGGAENSLYHNDGEGEFTNVTRAAGLEGSSGHAGVVVGDIDNDGFADLVLTGRESDIFFNDSPAVRVFRNNGDGTFADVTETAGIVPPETPGSAAMADIDGDGFLDLFITAVGSLVTRVQQQSRLYHNNGDFTFSDITEQSGIDSRLAACATGFSDYDGDGDGDLFVANCNDVRFAPRPIQLFRNNGDLTFDDVTAEAGLRRINGFWMGISFADYDNDGDIDVFSTNVGTTASGLGSPFPHALIENNGDGTFTDVARQVGVANWEFGWGTSFTDFDNDGYADLFFGGTLLRIPPLPVNFIGSGGDGNPGRLFLNNLGNSQSPKGFTDASDQLGINLSNAHTTGVAYGDFNDDGFQDIFIAAQSRSEENASVLLQNTDNGNHWIGVDLTGTTSNRDAVGAKVTVVAGDLTQVKEVYAGSSFLSADSQSLRFGLGERGNDPVIHVRWPSGLEETFATNGQLEQVIQLVEGEGFTPVAGDANLDRQVDQLDIVQVLQRGKYLTGEPADRTDGDFNGDGLFDQLDIVASLQAGQYLQGPYAAGRSASAASDDMASLDESVEAALLDELFVAWD